MYSLRSPTDSVDKLPGCGKVLTERFRSVGICTYDDLIKTKLSVPGLPVARFQKVAREQLKTSKELVHHSWQGLVAHVLRPGGAITRVVINNLVIKPHSIKFIVLWTDRQGNLHRKTCSPAFLLMLQILWFKNDILSDDEGDGPEGCPPLTHPLPKFLIDTSKPESKALSTFESQALGALVKDLTLHGSFFPRDETDVWHDERAAPGSEEEQGNAGPRRPH